MRANPLICSRVKLVGIKEKRSFKENTLTCKNIFNMNKNKFSD